MRWFVATGGGTSMTFGVSPRNKVAWASPQMAFARGWQLSRLRAALRMKRYTFYEVAVVLPEGATVALPE